MPGAARAAVHRGDPGPHRAPAVRDPVRRHVRLSLRRGRAALGLAPQAVAARAARARRLAPRRRRHRDVARDGAAPGRSSRAAAARLFPERGGSRALRPGDARAGRSGRGGRCCTRDGSRGRRTWSASSRPWRWCASPPSGSSSSATGGCASPSPGGRGTRAWTSPSAASWPTARCRACSPTRTASCCPRSPRDIPRCSSRPWRAACRARPPPAAAFPR